MVLRGQSAVVGDFVPSLNFTKFFEEVEEAGDSAASRLL